MTFYRVIRRFLCIMVPLLWRVKITGKERLPQGAAVICGNHTATTDPVFVITAFNKLEPLFILLKKELHGAPILGWILRKMGTIAVDREMSDMKAVKASMEKLKAGQKLLIFPEGTRSRGREIEPKSGAALFAHRYNAPLVPIYITAGSKPLFSRVNVIIGEPYYVTCDQKRPPADFYQTESRKLMSAIFALGEGS
ncbi:1-acyl-sn-glycerol-3-phosphate acyltransferase [Clostridia bacterium]|nr:1-acyl-sn-glycerol-3-phosphate acyltransferase [Clostridia bacterium]GHV37460.1 1-acyl-sn-glycerol-3-phosphate acyltransferase [Clostridia bacterium]